MGSKADSEALTRGSGEKSLSGELVLAGLDFSGSEGLLAPPSPAPGSPVVGF